MTIRTYAAISAALCLTATTAYADVVVVVGAKSGIKTLTKEQVSGVFLAKKAYPLPDGEDAMPLDLQEGNAVRDEFYAKVTGKSAAQLNAYWPDAMLSGLSSPRPMRMPDVDSVKQMLDRNPDYIGYVSKKAVDSSVRVVFAP
jgi:ABC-type phosphate transport system substrate-binding protein